MLGTDRESEQRLLGKLALRNFHNIWNFHKTPPYKVFGKLIEFYFLIFEKKKFHTLL